MRCLALNERVFGHGTRNNFWHALCVCDFLMRIIRFCYSEMTSEYQSVRADMESQSMSEHEREAAFAALVTRVDGTVAEKHRMLNLNFFRCFWINVIRN